MLSEIVLINIQTWKKLSLKLHAGINVLSGMSNHGKSVLFKCYRALIFPTFYAHDDISRLIRYDKSTGEFHLIKDDGHALKVTYYNNNTQVISLYKDDKLLESSVMVPTQNMIKLFNLYHDKDERIIYNLLDQNMPIPFVTSNLRYNKRATDFILKDESLEQLIVTSEMNKKAINDLIKTNKANLDKRKASLDRLPNLDLEALELTKESLLESEKIYNDIINVGTLIEKLNENLLDEPEPVQNMNEIDNLISEYKHIDNIIKLLTELSKLENKYKNYNIKTIETEIKNLSIINSIIESQKSLLSINDLDKPKEVNEEEVDNLLKEVRYIDEINNNIKSLYELLLSNESTKLTYNNILKEISSIEEELEICPLCGNEFTKNGCGHND